MRKKYSLNLSMNSAFECALAMFCLAVYAGPLFFPLMDKDAAHHANIALHMYETGDYASLVDRNMQYLDKPHFLFWIAALSFKMFGVNTFAYRLPAVLFAIAAVICTYKITRHLADKTTALLAAAMLASAQAFVLSISDARMETPLTASIIFGLWHLVLYIDKRKFSNLVLAALGAGIAFSTKGWIGPIIILMTGFSRILLDKKWNVLFQPKTWLFVPLFAISISPVLYCYYLQYDLHPERTVRGMNHISGVKFILWGQLFERYKGFDEGGRYSSYWFLYHTFLWAFFPWSIIAYMAVLFWVRRMFLRRKWRSPIGFIALSFTFILVVISFSKFKMPHYIIMLLPLAAIFTAPYLLLVLSYIKTRKIFLAMQVFFACIIVLAVLLLNYYFFTPFIWVVIFGSLLLILLAYLIAKKDYGNGGKAVYVTAMFALVFNFFLFYNFFPHLMKYQGGNELAFAMKRNNISIPVNDLMLIETNSHSFDFYTGHNHPVADSFEQRYPLFQNKYFLVTAGIKRDLESKGFKVDPVISHVDYNINTIKLKFLNEKTRDRQLDTLMVARITK